MNTQNRIVWMLICSTRPRQWLSHHLNLASINRCALSDRTCELSSYSFYWNVRLTKYRYGNRMEACLKAGTSLVAGGLHCTGASAIFSPCQDCHIFYSFNLKLFLNNELQELRIILWVLICCLLIIRHYYCTEWHYSETDITATTLFTGHEQWRFWM